MNERYLTVSALTKYIKKKIDIDPHLQEVWLKGEISNFNHHSRGHMYLTIKDNQSRIQAVMFAGNNRSLKFTPENGMNVLIKGEISVFEPYGQYQLYIREMQPDGIGELYLAYEQLKEKLNKQGYFDEQYKKVIPKFPMNIGLITSPTGAAVRDMITTIKRRFPIAQLTVIPVIVQGDDAPNSIQTGIAYANELASFDVLIVGRGGGSIEDLWGFNDEGVAKAIFHSKIPVITGIGHETDITISDFAADLRASTPTGAAELAVPSLLEVKNNLKNMTENIIKAMLMKLIKKHELLQHLRKSYAFHLPKQLINEKEQSVDRLTDKLRISFNTLQKNKQNHYQHTVTRLNMNQPTKDVLKAIEKVNRLKKQQYKNANHLLQRKHSQLHSLIDKLTLLNPLHTMKRGFALPYTEKGELIKTTTQVHINDKVEVRLSDGSIYCHVEDVRKG